MCPPTGPAWRSRDRDRWDRVSRGGRVAPLLGRGPYAGWLRSEHRVLRWQGHAADLAAASDARHVAWIAGGVLALARLRLERRADLRFEGSRSCAECVHGEVERLAAVHPDGRDEGRLGASRLRARSAWARQAGSGKGTIRAGRRRADPCGRILLLLRALALRVRCLEPAPRVSSDDAIPCARAPLVHAFEQRSAPANEPA